MKVFVVEFYIDYEESVLSGVFSTREKAETAIENKVGHLKKSLRNQQREYYEISEIEVDAE